MPLSVRENCTCCAASRAMPARPEYRLLPAGHLRRLGDVQISLFHEPLDDLVEQLGELSLQLGVALGVAGGFAAQHLEHVRRELARVHQGLEDRLRAGRPSSGRRLRRPNSPQNGCE